MPKACIVPNCWKQFKDNPEKCSVFKVPQDEELRRKWESAIPGIEVLKSSQHVCERHFEPTCIVRKLEKRGPDGKIFIDIPYKRPRLLKSVVPSIFYCGYPAHEGTDKENSTTAKVATSDTDVNRCLVPRTASFRAIDNEEEAVKSVDELKSLNEAENISSTTDNLDVEIESHFSSDDQFLTFSVTKDSQIHFQIGDDVCTVTVSNSWSIVESSTEQKLLLSQIVSNAANNGDIAVIRKGIVIDDKRRIKYAVHGKLIKHDVPQLPQELTDPRMLPNILNEFHVLHVCDGLGDANINLIESVAVYKDNMKMNRSTKCMLIGKKKTCNFCARLRKTLRQKDFRYTKRDEFKRFAALSNPVDQRKFNAMRLKINRERRAKNRRTIRMKILSAYLTQKQDEFDAIKDHLLEERCAMLNIPEVQKNALRQIVAAAKQKDLRGRRYTKDWITMCMLMNIQSSAYYEFIRKNQIIPLPCTRTVRNYFSLIDSKCGN